MQIMPMRQYACKELCKAPNLSDPSGNYKPLLVMVKNKRRDNSVQSENKNNDTSKPGEPTISGSDMGHSSEGKQQRKKGDRTTHAGDTQSQIELTFQKQDLKRKRMSDGGGADAKKSVKVRKLVPPRPFPTVPSGSSATGPKSAHGEGKNRICITRRTALGAYLRRCKELVLKDGYVPASPFIMLFGCKTLKDTIHSIFMHWVQRFLICPDSPYHFLLYFHFLQMKSILRSRQELQSARMKLSPKTKTKTSLYVSEENLH